MTIGKAFAAIAFVLSLSGPLGAQGRGAARRYTLSGTVVDGAGKPMPGVELNLISPWKNVGDPVTSGAEGQFAFRGVEAGEYLLSADVFGIGFVRYGESNNSGALSAIRLGGEHGDKSVVFRILQRGSIEGVIRDEFGDPMQRINVTAARPVWRGGHIVTGVSSQSTTDDRGRYRLGNLPPGDYIVCADMRASYPAPVAGPLDYGARVENRSYVRTCNRALQLASGQRAQVDLVPTVGILATVRGHVRNLPPLTGFGVNLVGDEQFRNQVGGSVDISQSTFTIRGVAPGRYRLRAQTFANTPNSLVAEMILDVGGSDIDGLELDLAAEAAVQLTFAGVPQGHSNEVGATVQAVGNNQIQVGYTQNKDGGIQVRGLPPGAYRLIVSSPADTCVESVRQGERNVRGLPFELEAGSTLHLDVVLSQNCGAIHARAVRDDAAVPGARFVLLRSGTPKEPVELTEDVADDEGELVFSNFVARPLSGLGVGGAGKRGNGGSGEFSRGGTAGRGSGSRVRRSGDVGRPSARGGGRAMIVVRLLLPALLGCLAASAADRELTGSVVDANTGQAIAHAHLTVRFLAAGQPAPEVTTPF
ncbi:MAG: carboxypeptidase-like regulatory domain-containing protein [Ignavibacteriota bacterium]